MVGCLALTFTLAAMGGSPPAPEAPSSVPVRAEVAAATAADLLNSPQRRVRAMNRPTLRLLTEGMRRSPTFAALMTSVQQTDVIVYVETTLVLPSNLGGRLLLQAVTAHERYVRVQIRASLATQEAIEVIAHELQHALEIAGDGSVLDEAGLEALYRRIGYATRHDRGFDTLAARRIGERVRAELRA